MRQPTIIAINDRMLVNIYRGTATSASWNVTYRLWLTIFALILIGFSRGLVSDTASVLGRTGASARGMSRWLQDSEIRTSCIAITN